MKSIKGGYQLISLGMVALGSLTALPSGELAKIGATTKRIVLTDITLDGSTRLPDIEVQIEKSGTDILLNNVYGKDLKIKSDGDVVVTTNVKGVQVYLHQLAFGNGDGTLFIRSSNPSKITTKNDLYKLTYSDSSVKYCDVGTGALLILKFDGSPSSADFIVVSVSTDADGSNPTFTGKKYANNHFESDTVTAL